MERGGGGRERGELGLTELLGAEAERHGSAPVVAGGDQIGSGLEWGGEKKGMGKTTGHWQLVGRV